MSYSQKRVSYTLSRVRTPIETGGPSARVTVAGENKDGIDGHRHGTPLLEYTGNLSGGVFSSADALIS